MTAENAAGDRAVPLVPNDAESKTMRSLSALYWLAREKAHASFDSRLMSPTDTEALDLRNAPERLAGLLHLVARSVVPHEPHGACASRELFDDLVDSVRSGWISLEVASLRRICVEGDLVAADRALADCLVLASIERHRDFVIGSIARLVMDDPSGALASAVGGSPHAQAVHEQVAAARRFESSVAEMNLRLALDDVDASAILAHASGCADAFRACMPTVQKTIASVLVRTSRGIGIVRGKEERRDVRLLLSKAMLALNVALRARGSRRLSEEFEDAYDFYRCVSDYPELLEDKTIRSELSIACSRVYECGHQLLATKTFVAERLSLPDYSKRFHEKLGEICRVCGEFWSIRGRSASAILEEALDHFQIALDRGSDVVFSGQRAAECLMRLRRPAVAKELYARVIAAPNVKNSTRWEAYRQKAMCCIALAVNERTDANHRLANDYFEEAERCLFDAALVWEVNADYANLRHERNYTLHGFLAYCYLQWGRHSDAEHHAKRILTLGDPEQHRRYRSLNYCVLGVALIRQGRYDAAADALRKSLNLATRPKHRLQPWLALREIARRQRDFEGLRIATSTVLDVAASLDLSAVRELTDHEQEALLDADAMAAYISRCKERLRGGDARGVLTEVRRLIRVAKFMDFEQGDDRVLLTIRAMAERQVGHAQAAMKTLRYLQRIDLGSKNQGITATELGKCYLSINEPRAGAIAFESAFAAGGRSEIGVLALAAKARIQCGDYDEALRHLMTIRQSGDALPQKTLITTATLYWRRYCDSRSGIGGDEQDVQRATEAALSALSRETDPSAWREPIGRLSEMITHHVAERMIHGFLEDATEATPQRAVLLGTLAMNRCFSARTQDLAVALLRSHIDSPLLPAAIRYLAETWRDAFMRLDRGAVERLMTEVAEAIQEERPSRRTWTRLLNHLRADVTDALIEEVTTEIRLLLRDVAKEGVRAEASRDVALETLRRQLKTKMAAVAPRAYRGAHGRIEVLAQLTQFADYWAGIRGVSSASVVEHPISEAWQFCRFQKQLVASLLNVIVAESADIVANVRVEVCVVRLEAETLRLEVRLSLPPSAHESVRRVVFESAERHVHLWNGAFRRFAGAEVRMTIDDQAQAFAVFVPIWSKERSTPNKWEAFSEAEIRGSDGADLLLPAGDTPDAAEMVRCALVLLDAAFERSYLQSCNIVEAPVHRILNEMARGSESDDLANSLDKPLRALLEEATRIHRPRRREFDLAKVVREEIRRLGDALDKPLDAAYSSDSHIVLVNGSEPHITLAFQDIFDNVHRALRAREQARLRIHIRDSDDGAHVVIANNASASVGGGFGIGARTVRWVVEGLHGGSVEYGDLAPDDEDDYSYEWRLFLPRNARETSA